MLRSRGARWLATLALLATVLQPIQAQDAASPLVQVPADAPIVVHVRGLERTKNRLITLAKNALPDVGAELEAKIDEVLKEGLDGREIKALPKDGSIFGVFTEMPKPGQEEPAGAVIFAVTSFKDFRDGFLTEQERKTIKENKPAGYETVTVRDKEFYLVDRKGFAVVTMQKEVATKFAGKYAGLETKLAKDAAKRLLESDAAIYVDMAAVNKEFGDQMKAFRPLMDIIFQQAGAQADKASMEMMKAVVNGGFQLIEDSRVFLASVDFRPEGLAVHFESRVGADTKVNALLKESKTASLTEIGKLPAGQMGYLAGVVDGQLLRTFGPLFQGMVAESKGPQSKLIGDLFTQLSEAGPKGFYGDFSMPTQGVQVWQYNDPAKAADAYLKMFKSLVKGESYNSIPLKTKPEIKDNAQTHREFKLHSLHLEWDFDALAERTPQGGKEMAEMMKTIMGDQLNLWFGTNGKLYVQVSAKDWATAQRRLDELLDGKNPVGSQPGFQAALKQLPSQSTLLSLIDAPQYLKIMVGFMGASLKAQGVPIMVPEYNGPKGKIFIGMAIALQLEVGSFDLWWPAEAAGEIRKIVEPLIGGGAIQ